MSHSRQIYAITLDQPWASLIAVHAKLIETRSWQPPHHLIGQPLAIHAGKNQNYIGSPHLPVFNANVARYLGSTWDRSIPLGAVVAVARLAGATQIEEHTRLPSGDELLFGDYQIGRWMWRLEDVRSIDPPIRTRGYQRVWRWTPPPDLSADLPTRPEQQTLL